MNNDLRYSLRLLLKNPGFAAVAILSISLGVGAATAIFSVVYAVLLDPYPYRGAERIGSLRLLNKKGPQGGTGYTMAQYLEMKARARTAEDMMAMNRRNVVMTGSGLPEAAVQEDFSSNAFDFFGVPPLFGRVFTPKDIAGGRPPEPVGVLSYAFWQRHFAGRPDVLGEKVKLDDKVFTIVGVLPIRFTWHDADIYVPMDLRPSAAENIGMIIKVKPGVSKQQVADEFQPFHEQFSKDMPSYYYPDRPFRTEFQSVNEGILGKFANTLLALLAAVGFLLLIACANVANLLLARATAREGEMAVRVSLGAGRGRLIRQLLTESVLLSLAGGALGVALAYQGVKAVVALMPEYSVPHEAIIAINWPVLWFALSVSMLTGVLFGLAPALQLSSLHQAESLKGAGRGGAIGGGSHRLRDLLMLAEITLSLVLLTGAGLAIRGLLSLEQQKLGYDPNNVLTFRLQLPAGRYTQWSQRHAFFTEALHRLGRIPRVQAASVSSMGTPPWNGATSKFQIDGQVPAGGAQLRMNLVSDGYFDTVKVPLVRGRYLTNSDVARASRMAVVSEDLIKKYFPAGQDPLGRHLRIDLLSQPMPPGFLKAPQFDASFEIVGVVGTARNAGLRDQPEPAVYLPDSLLYPPGAFLLLRTASDPLAFANAAREAVRSVDPGQPVMLVRSLDQWLGQATAYPRFATFLFGIFGAIGMTLAAIGVFSVVSYTVARRTREFGVRMALGASPAQVFRLVLASTGRVLLAGLVLGIALSVFASRALADRIEGMGTADPFMLLAVPLVLSAAAFLACYVPARSATRIQPMDALRHE